MTGRLRILLIEDEPSYRQALIDEMPHSELSVFENFTDYLSSEAYQNNDWVADFILLDLCSSRDPKGLQTLQHLGLLNVRHPNSEFWVQSAIADPKLMRVALAAGAHRFISKEQLLFEIKFLELRMQEQLKQREIIEKALVGVSGLRRRLINDVLRLRSFTQGDILIEAETGSGKEICAQLLHKKGPFVAVNCAAIPVELFEAEFFGAEKGAFSGAHQQRIGHFESASGGTLFLDEIQSLPLAQQVKLLRVIESRNFCRVGSSQEQAFNARIVCASSLPLRAAVSNGLFREDLYYRISALQLQVPPLRARSEDIAPLIEHFSSRQDARPPLRWTPEALHYLTSAHDWPGNVRELRNFVNRGMVHARLPIIDVEEAQQLLGQDSALVVESSLTAHVEADNFSAARDFQIDWDEGLDANLARLEKQMLEQALSNMKSAQARDFLQIGKSRFYDKLKSHGIKA